MICIIIGTKAQLIKMAPILQELDRRDEAYKLVFTGQHSETMDDLLIAFNLRQPDIQLVADMEADSKFKAFNWLLTVLRQALFRQRREIWSPKPTVTLVHGDTFSTLLGALLARIERVPVAHIEAGLRSFNIWNPFPEELIRNMVTGISNIFYCSGEWAASNIKSSKKRHIVNTEANTLLDALRYATESEIDLGFDPPNEDYAVVSMHRYENMNQTKRFEFLLEMLQLCSRRIHVLFVLHPVTRKKLVQTGWMDRLQAIPTITLLPRMNYVQFIALLSNSRFLWTDGGSNQEEAAYLGLPCLLLRKATERQEGINENVLISNYDPVVFRQFIDNTLSQQWKKNTLPNLHPTLSIVDDLQKRFELK